MRKPLLVVAGMLMVSFNSVLFGDVIQPDYHPVSRCVTVGNLDAYPDIALVGIYNGPGNSGSVGYRVMADSCLKKGYKFNTLAMFWVIADYLDSVGVEDLPVDQMIGAAGLQKSRINILAAPDWGFITSDIEPYGGTVPDENPLVSEELIYHLDFNNVKISLEQVKKISHFEDGSQKVENFQPVLLQRKLHRTPSSGAFSVDAAIGNGYLMLTVDSPEKINGTLLDCNGRAVCRFYRNFAEGTTNLIPGASLGSGIYWLQLESTTGSSTLRLTTFK